MCVFVWLWLHENGHRVKGSTHTPPDPETRSLCWSWRRPNHCDGGAARSRDPGSTALGLRHLSRSNVALRAHKPKIDRWFDR